MKTKVLLLLLAISIQSAFAQLITTTPVFPADNQPVQVIFNAQEGNRGLMGYTGDVYAHTGVITNLSTGPSDWKYVKTNWGTNTPATKLERIGTDLYRFTTGTQTIREYYGVPPSEQILQIAFVFRSASQVGGSYLEGKTETGGDIFADVYPAGLFVKFTQPADYANLVSPGAQMIIEAIANSADSVVLYVDNVRVSASTSASISYNYTAALSGKHYFRVRAFEGNETATNSAYYYVLTSTAVMERPAGTEDGINYMNDSTVILSLYAPGKNNVFVLGDFTNWEFSDEGFMYKTPDGNRFWKQINGLIPQKEYVYQYKVNNELLIPDPYADKILDPWNDKYISNATYPDLIPYPYDKTSQLASVLQTAQTPYQWTVTNFERPAKTDLVIYELLIRDFIATHNYQTLIDTLTYLKRLGVNTIELMPVYEFEGNSSWGYNTAFHFAPDKYYGTKNDLKEFIDVCHQQGFAVILDMVLNHVFGSSPFARLYWDSANNRPSLDNPWLNPVAKHDFNVGYDFNHESPATKALVKRVVEYWIEEYNIDGYRFDLSKGFTQKNTLNNTNAWGQYDASRVAIWKNIANQIWAVDNGVYVILEHFADNLEEKELANYGMMLWGNLNHAYRQISMGWSDGSDLSWISHKARGWNDPHVVGYMESHDEERLMFSINTWGNMSNTWYNIKNADTAIDRVIAASAFFYTVPGPKMLWQFGEVGYDYSIDFNGRVGEKPIRWDYMNNWRRKHLYNMTAALINLKLEYDVFRTNDFSMSTSGLLKTINLRGNDMSVAVIGNFDVHTREITPTFNVTGKWYNYFTGDSINVTSLTDKIELKAGEFRLYTSKRLTVPETGLGIGDSERYRNIIMGNIYPSPASSIITVPLNLPASGEISLILYNSAGNLVKTLYNGTLTAGVQRITVNLGNTPAGLYYVKLITSNRVETARLVISK